MASFNKVILIGNLTRDPDVRQTQSGTSVGEIGLAVNRSWFDKASNQKKEEVTFIDVTLWGRQAEVAGQYLKKGSPAMIEGRLQLESWDDKTTGAKRQKLKVICESLQLLGSRGDDGNGSATQSSTGQRQGAPAANGRSNVPSGDDGPPRGNDGPPVNDDVPL